MGEGRVDALNHALRGLPQDRIRYHTCYSINIGPRVHDMELKHIVDIMLRVNAGAYSFEAANPRHEHEWKVWREVRLPDGKSLIPGVITHSSNIVEHPELIAERIGRFAQAVGRENVIAGADCGFASFASTCEVHPSVVWVKLKALAEGARLASAELWRQQRVTRFGAVCLRVSCCYKNEHENGIGAPEHGTGVLGLQLWIGGSSTQAKQRDRLELPITCRRCRPCFDRKPEFLMSLTEILKTVGPSAAIIFAAWIFMGFLQQRYDAAVERYRAIIAEYRSGKASAARCDNIREQVQTYKRRCVLMAYSHLLGLTAAIFLLATLILGELVVIFPKAVALDYVGAITTIVGIGLVIASAVMVMMEGAITHRQLELRIAGRARAGRKYGNAARRQIDRRRTPDRCLGARALTACCRQARGCTTGRRRSRLHPCRIST